MLAAISTVLVPLAAFVLPGVVLVSRPARGVRLLGQAARAVLWSVTALTLMSLLAARLRLPPAAVWLTACLAVPLALLLRHPRATSTLPSTWRLLALAAVLLSAVAAFSLPFFLYHDGLPTGDVQKTIIWAEQMLRTRTLPDYSQSRALLNRDPVDFYTPGLHAYASLVLSAALHPLTALGLAGIIAAVCVALIAAALAAEVLPATKLLLPLITFVFILTNVRFLRYLREPGYHFQNVMGELLLFGALLLTAALLRRLSRHDAVLLVLTVATLTLTHQFSAFLAAFMLPPAIALAATFHRRRVKHFARQHQPAVLLLGGVLLLLLGSGFAIGLHRKIPHLFTAAPHLLSQVPPLADYPRSLGTVWFAAGLAGLTVLAGQAVRDRDQPLARTYFVLAAAVPLLLSQGPRFAFDIPPVRALFYAVVPLSICAAYVVIYLAQHLSRLSSPWRRAAALSLLCVMVAASLIGSVNRAYALSHSVRTNSTLRAEYFPIIAQLEKSAGAVLVDDYNRRSASWLVLSGQPMFARLASDLERQMDEAWQSPLRRELYLKQLDFEKIFSLGSQPEITVLLEKHNILWLTGVLDSSYTSFMYNPALQPAAWGDDIVLFERKRDPQPPDQPDPPTAWLLRASTLANDIGDREDTFEHLPASLRATRLSEPQHNADTTWRTTTTPLIPLQFNVGDFVRVLWDQEKTGQPNTTLELYVRFAEQPPVNLSLLTPAGTTHPLTELTNTIVLRPVEVPFTAKGFITLTVKNPDSGAVAIDLIALGPARVP